MNEPVKNYEPSELEKIAIKSVDTAFKRNQDYWQYTHKRQRRLYKMVMGGQADDKVEKAGRSHIKTAIPFMIYQIILAILENAIFSLENNIKLEATKLRKIIFGQEEMEEYLDFLLMDDNVPVKQPIRMGLSDLITHGTACVRPYFENDVRTVWDGQNESEMLVYSGPAFCNHASWDTFPTAGATSVKQLHEVVFVESVYPHELREWEKAGWIENVDELLENYREPTYGESDQDEKKDPREPKGDLETDEYGRIKILIYWGLFPLYKYQKYVDDSGKDRSADEVECLIIKPMTKQMILHMDRNPYFHQMKEVIFGKYFDIPGELWGESIFGMMERLLVHQEDWFNIIQDSANHEVYRDEIIPDNVDQAAINQDGPGRRFVIDADEVVEGKVPKYIERGPAILPDAYERSTYVDRLVQEVGGVMDMLKGFEGNVQKTKYEVEQLSQSLNVRFERTALAVQANYFAPITVWMMSMLSEFSDDDYIKAYTGLPFNPYKQFDPMIPNTAYRIKLEGSIRAIKSFGLQNQLRAFIEQAKGLQPMPNDEGELVTPNLVEMFFDLMRMSGLRDVDKYEFKIEPEVLQSAEQQQIPAETGGPNV